MGFDADGCRIVSRISTCRDNCVWAPEHPACGAAPMHRRVRLIYVSNRTFGALTTCSNAAAARRGTKGLEGPNTDSGHACLRNDRHLSYLRVHPVLSHSKPGSRNDRHRLRSAPLHAVTTGTVKVHLSPPSSPPRLQTPAGRKSPQQRTPVKSTRCCRSSFFFFAGSSHCLEPALASSYRLHISDQATSGAHY